MPTTVEPEDIQISFGRKPKEKAASSRTAKKLPRDTLTGMIAACNFVITVSGGQAYALENGEIDALSDALYDVIVQYPTAAKFLIEGGKISPWVKLSIVAFPIATKRYMLYQNTHITPSPNTPAPVPVNPFGVFPNGERSTTAEDETGPARSADRDDGLGENTTSESFYQPSQMGGNY